MRRALLASPACFLFLWACGYVGPVVPPSPELPIGITDLTAVERGSKIEISFSTPIRTTDNLAIRAFSVIDLRIGPPPSPFDLETWAASANRIPVQPPEPNDPDDPRPQHLVKTLPVADLIGQNIAIAVRSAIKQRGHFSPWSNVVRLKVIQPLEPPDIELQSNAEGVKLSWHPESAATHYEVYRQDSASSAPVHIGTAEQSEFIDNTAHFDATYRYSVVAAATSAESLPSESKTITPVDVFPPSVPASITALPTPDSVEVSWQRSPEPDLKGYYVYRSVDSGPFVRQGDLVTLPTYTDHNVEHGKTYRYQVSAIDQKNNESAKSPVAEATF